MDKLFGGEKAASSKLNRWVDPSFAELPEESFAVSRRRKAVSSKAEVKKPRKRAGEAGRSEPPTPPLVREPAPWDQDESWVDRHSPRSQAELAVHKKKIEEVESWIKVHTNTSKLQGGVLLLTGPSGCGKTATVKVLSLELDLRVQEWTNPSNEEPYSSTQHEWRTNGLSFTSQLTQFQDFLLRANKYKCLKMVGDGGATDRKFILVEDFPNQFYRQPDSLHDILRRFVKTSRCPLVFIVSDSLSGDSSSRHLFPKEIQEELDISSISFNPVAPTTMMKVLSRISTLEAGKSGGRMCVPDQAVLEKLCSGSSGDVRSAINSLQFSSLPDTSLEKGLLRKDRQGTSLGKAVSRTNQRKKRSKQKRDQEEEQAIGGKDASLFLFRALGKILHCKRGKQEDVEVVESPPGPPLPSHLSHHHREALLVDPEFVVERSHMSGEFFSLYLHQNYLDFFSEVEDVDRASEYLSDADLLNSDWTSRSTMEYYGSSVATRGLLHSNSQQVSVGFRPLHKPNWLLVNKKHRENGLAAQSLFRSFCLTPVSLQTELLPYLAKLTNPLRNQAQIAFIQDVGHMSLRRLPGRLKLEALTDKEPAQPERDSEEEEEQKKEEEGQAGLEEGLPESQPQPITSQDLLEEEELLIEDYNSD
ncbi:cell cycle checkpoint protein RAD17 isoform X2 [Gymnodraco acuticeps]|uniref:Cell cycle checkpoint protein RAD17 isoform X2 n=1 Tax=Gymnodraco acuticeps TaxID=8218 RepID=A0A6P8SW86_GYMAC|nr:cell cycle checkpoint protein RAD17 isoform X2 [Gymnodraco acuticeps]